jgi:hypothetical protein
MRSVKRLPLLVIVGLAGCGSSSGGDGVLRTTKNVTSLTAGQSEIIGVEALDANGKALTFTATPTGTCVTVAAADGGFKVTAGTTLCAAEVQVVTSSSLSKLVTVNVYDPKVMDIGGGLLIKYVNTYGWRWNDTGSGGDMDVTYWHPNAGAGWYPLGSFIEASYRDINADANVPMIVVQDSKNAGLLAAPTGYAEIYNDRGSGASNDGSVWRPLCPSGFVALGVVTQAGYSAPSTEDVRCVKASYTTKAKLGGRTYIDSGTGATMYLGVFGISYPDYTQSPDSRAALQPGTNAACPGWDGTSCDASIFNLLLVPLEVVVNSDNDAEPKLTAKAPLDTSKARFFSSVRVPFTLITTEGGSATPAARVAWNVANSPFYYLQREEKYSSIDTVDNSQGTTDAQYHYSIQTGFSQTDSQTFKQDVGIEVTAGGEVGFLGTGGSWEVKLTMQFGWEQSTSSTYAKTETRDFTFTVPAKAYAEIVQVTTQFRAVPSTGVAVSAPFNLSSNIIKYLQL